jgi:hypothetical protein
MGVYLVDLTEIQMLLVLEQQMLDFLAPFEYNILLVRRKLMPIFELKYFVCIGIPLIQQYLLPIVLHFGRQQIFPLQHMLQMVDEVD